MTSMTLTIERVRAFNGLDVLVARDEGLFAAEGLDLRIAEPVEGAFYYSAARGSLAEPVTTQGRLQARGEAAIYQG